MLITERQLKVKVELSSTKTQLIENQGWVVHPEKRIIDSKDNGLAAMLIKLFAKSFSGEEPEGAFIE